MFGTVRFLLLSVLLLAMMVLLYVRKTVSDPYFLSRQKLDELSEFDSIQKRRETHDKLILKEPIPNQK